MKYWDLGFNALGSRTFIISVLKVVMVGWRHSGKERTGPTQFSTKFVAKLSFMPCWSRMYFFFLSFEISSPSWWPECTSTHQCTNLDGWCIDRILFSIPVPSQVEFFLFASSQPWSQFVFWELYFLPVPHPILFFLCFWKFSHPPT